MDNFTSSRIYRLFLTADEYYGVGLPAHPTTVWSTATHVV